MEEIVVAGGYAILRSVQEVKRVKTEDLLASVAATAGVATPLLPEVALLFACRGMRKLLATCRPPGRTAFKVKGCDGKIERVELAHPWLVFMHIFEGMAYESMRIYGAARRPFSEEETLFKLPFRNLYSDCKICMGRDVKFELDGPFAAKAETAERHFYESVFNGDLDLHAEAALPEGWESGDELDAMRTWSRKSAEAGFDPLKVQWRSATELKELLGGILGRPK